MKYTDNILFVKHQTEEKTPAEQRASMTWAQRLKRVFSIDVETCSECRGFEFQDEEDERHLLDVERKTSEIQLMGQVDRHRSICGELL